ncbi:MAG: carboxymuconolactone decarboxylase family protein, partial [Solirubrobacteraceae bacterium]
MSGARLPLRGLPATTEARLGELGGRPINLYRTLAAQPELLDAWIEYAWALRGRCTTPRTLRELVILRVAQLRVADYEWTAHVEMARAAGVDLARIERLEHWREVPGFDERERAALDCAEAMCEGPVSDQRFAELRALFTDAEIVELTLTVSTYLGLAALLEA